MIYFYPLFFLQAYLILTLVVFAFGPIEYGLIKPYSFWFLIFLYHISFFIGYMFPFLMRKKVSRSLSYFALGQNASLRVFYLVLFLSVVASIVSFKGEDSFLELFNPMYWFESALNGALNPGEAYNQKIARVGSDVTGDKLLNIGLFFIAFSKVLLVPFVVFFWPRLGVVTRFFSVFVTLLPLLSSLSNGTNKGVFDFVILYGFSLIVYFLYHKFKFGSYGLKTRKLFLVVILMSFLGALLFFGSAMSERGGDLRYIESRDSLDNIKVTEEALERSENNFLYYTYAWLGSYIVQGYYGFSLALDERFDTTYGVGNSAFLSRNFESLLGADLRSRTFQYKIDHIWGETTQWHSLYSFFANDFHFLGVSLVCFFIAYMMAFFWLEFLGSGNIYAGAIMPVFAILIIFIPANNQIFGFLDGLSSFFWFLVFWFFSSRKFKF